jgi:hypothetical protein
MLCTVRGVWCGVVWCGVVWCGVVWCGVEHNTCVLARYRNPTARSSGSHPSQNNDRALCIESHMRSASQVQANEFGCCWRLCHGRRADSSTDCTHIDIPRTADRSTDCTHIDTPRTADSSTDCTHTDTPRTADRSTDCTHTDTPRNATNLSKFFNSRCQTEPYTNYISCQSVSVHPFEIWHGRQKFVLFTKFRVQIHYKVPATTIRCFPHSTG